MSPWQIIIPIVWAGGLLGAGLALSKRIEKEYFPDYFFPLVGILGLIIFGLGLAGALYKSIFIVVTIVLAILFAGLIWTLRHEILGFIKTRPILLIIILIPLIWYALASLSYPVSTDALYFHLGLPKIYAAFGRVFFIPANLFSASPRTSEMITTGLYALGLERGAQFFIVLVAAILVLSVWRRARETGGTGMAAVLIMFTIPIFMGQVTGSKNDYLLWGLSLFALMKFLQFDQGKGIDFLVISGIGAGMAAGTKAIGLALIGPIGLILLYNIALGKYKAVSLLYFMIAFLVWAMPWYLYSWLVTGNPVFPFFDNVFHSSYSSMLFNSFNAELAIKSVDRNILNLIISPLRIIFNPDAYDGRLGYGIILFPTMLLFVRKVPPALKVALGISIIFYLIWFFGFPFARFILPMAPLLAIAGSYFIFRLNGGQRMLRIIALSSLAIGVALPIPSVIRDTLPRAVSVIKGTPKYEFLENYKTLDPYQTKSGESIVRLSYIKCWKDINSHTPLNSRIGILASFWTRADGYYLDRDFLYLNPSEQNLYDFTELQDDATIKASLKRLGINYLVLDSVILGQFSGSSTWSDIVGFDKFATGVSALNAYCERYGSVIYSDDRYLVYKI